MTKNDFTLLNTIQENIKDCTKKPEVYLSVQKSKFEDFKKTTKDLYDLAVKSKLLSQTQTKSLPELIIDGFDTEQIWQQLELENNEALSLSKFSKILAKRIVKKTWDIPLSVKKNDNPKASESERSLNESKGEEEEEEEEDVYSNKSDEDLIEEDEKIAKKKLVNNKKRKRTTEVDDKFFKLDELDEYLQKEDKKVMKSKKKDDSSDDEESIDLFNNLSELDDEEDDDKSEDKKQINYSDFFDSPRSDNEDDERGDEGKNENYDNYENDDEDNRFNDEHSENENYPEQQEVRKEKKKVKFNLSNNSDESDSSEDFTMDNVEIEKPDNTKQSSLEARQERLKKRIKQLEEEAISEKPWQLKGETNALNRPQNSLLEEYVEFDTVTRPAPIMTEQTTMKLEDIIRGRIKDKAWDDVEKKFKPVETPTEYKKKLIMNQEKSKESLAQIYENEYIKQREALNSDDKDEQPQEEPPEHIEIRERMHNLFRKLDALSNFHYTPKQAKPEIKIVSNLPAVSMEEVAPIATADATLLAPEEIQTKQKGDLIGKSERTKTDMKRERRKKKLKQHAKAINQSKKLTENTKQKKSLKNTSKLVKLKGRNIIDVSAESNKMDGKSIKSSTAFFTQLQDQVQNSIKAKTSTSGTKKKKNELSAVRLKL